MRDWNPCLRPGESGNCEIKNRIVLTSMGGTDLFGWMEKNHFDKDGARFIMEVAKNNAGLVLPAASRCTIPCSASGSTKIKRCIRI